MSQVSASIQAAEDGPDGGKTDIKEHPTSGMRITYCSGADALAVELHPQGRSVRIQSVSRDVRLDWDAQGRLIGVEVLNASAHYALKVLERLDSPVEWLSLTEAAAESGISHQLLRRLIGDRKLESTRRGRRHLIARHALWNYLEAREPLQWPP